MTKQEQINEMAKIIALDGCGDCNNCKGKGEYGCYFNAYKGNAEAIYDAGYRKDYISEERAREIGKEMFDKVRKKTAREILQTLYDQCYEYNPRLPEESIGHIIPINILTLAKQYGVEVEE